MRQNHCWFAPAASTATSASSLPKRAREDELAAPHPDAPLPPSKRARADHYGGAGPEAGKSSVIACCFNASVAVGFNLVARGVSRLVCQRQFTIGENYKDMVACLRVGECAC